MNDSMHKSRMKAMEMEPPKKRMKAMEMEPPKKRKKKVKKP